jgi:HD-GYP domain-containing protein (c-di-GMP phosphodiesterase class II)
MADLETENIEVKYKLRSIRELFQGDIILHPLFRDDGLMLINKYTKLTQTYIKKINAYYNKPFSVIVIENNEDFSKFLINKGYETDDFIKMLTQVAEATKEFSIIPMSVELYLGTKIKPKVIKEENSEVNEDYSIIIDTLASTPFWNIIEENLDSPIAQNRIKNVKNILIDKLCTDVELLNLLKLMKKHDDLLILHSINMLCISLNLAACLEMKEEELIELSFCALFCSIGFINFPPKDYHHYLRKKVHNEFADKVIKSSIKILSKTEFCRSKNIIYGVLDRYETYNGEGAPLKKRGKEISLFGRILCIVSIYERLVSGYFMDNPFSHNEAIDIMWNDERNIIDLDILKIFIFRTTIYKIGQPTLFYFGKQGKIIGFSNYIEAPIYPIVEYSDGTIINYYGG